MQCHLSLSLCTHFSPPEIHFSVGASFPKPLDDGVCAFPVSVPHPTLLSAHQCVPNFAHLQNHVKTAGFGSWKSESKLQLVTAVKIKPAHNYVLEIALSSVVVNTSTKLLSLHKCQKKKTPEACRNFIATPDSAFTALTAFLRAEQSGEIDGKIQTWLECCLLSSRLCARWSEEERSLTKHRNRGQEHSTGSFQ